MAGLWSDHFPAAEKTPVRFFPCKTRGMWSEHAEKQPSPPPPPPPPPLSRSQRCLLCRTCNASCRLFTSNTPQNPNRQFYKCSAFEFDHKFFKWADEVNPNEFIDVPYCGGCTAGVCRVRKEKSGPNAGRVMFMCRVKEGEGSCGYRVWQDELDASPMSRANANLTSSQSSTTNNDHTRPANTDLVEENESPVTDTLQCHGVTSRKTEQLKRAQRIADERATSFQSPSPTNNSSNHTKPANTDLFEENVNKSNEGADIESSRRAHRLSDVRVTLFQSPTVNTDCSEPTNVVDLVEENNQSNEETDNESLVIDTSQHLQCLGGVTSSSKVEHLINCQENRPDESLKRPHKRSRHGDLKAPSSLVSSESLAVGPSVSVEHCWMVAAIRQNLSSQLQGWWGRLAFHPMPCLMTHTSKSLDCYSTFTMQGKTLVNSRDLTTLTGILLGVEGYKKPLLDPCCNTQLSGTKPFRVALDASSNSDPSTETNMQNVMSTSISKAFGQAAEHLQNDFLSLLDKMDVGDYETMSRAAEATFAALDRLLFNHQDFKGRTEEYIHCAMSLAEIERTMPGNESHQKLIEHCSSERTRLDEINSVHAKTVDSVNNNKKRLESLQEEVSSTMDWLFQIEAELSCCEVEMRNMERELEKISRNKVVLAEKHMIAANELEKSKMLLEQKEVERDAAKTAFERARELLRG